MALLDELLGGLAGTGLRQPQATSNAGGGVTNVLMALLPVVLGMMSNRQGGTTMGMSGAGGAGGAGGLGGLGGLLQRMQQQGYADEAQSWVARGPNRPISPDALSRVFGRDGLSQIASQAGVSEGEAQQGLSQLLPEVVDTLTPEGQLPAADQLLASIDDYARRLEQ